MYLCEVNEGPRLSEERGNRRTDFHALFLKIIPGRKNHTSEMISQKGHHVSTQ